MENGTKTLDDNYKAGFLFCSQLQPRLTKTFMQYCYKYLWSILPHWVLVLQCPSCHHKNDAHEVLIDFVCRLISLSLVKVLICILFLLFQVVSGDELESDRYLISIEERLCNHPSSDTPQAGSVNTEQKQEFKRSFNLTQPSKRKRQVSDFVSLLISCFCLQYQRNLLMQINAKSYQ